MIADFFTKPLQGCAFHKMRNTILGIKESMMEEYKEYWTSMLAKFGLSTSAATT